MLPKNKVKLDMPQYSIDDPCRGAMTFYIEKSNFFLTLSDVLLRFVLSELSITWKCSQVTKGEDIIGEGREIVLHWKFLHHPPGGTIVQLI